MIPLLTARLERRAKSFCAFLLSVLCPVASSAFSQEVRGIYGIHDAEPNPSEYLNHIRPHAGPGWVTATVAVGHNPADTSGADFSSLANQGHTIICRINNGYFPNGTIPLTNEYDNFAARCSNFVVHSTGCRIWVIGNECNLSGEWPFNGTKFAYVSPQDYARCFRKVYNAIKAVRPDDTILPQPPAPFAGPFPASTLNGFPADGNPINWVQYLNQTLTAIAETGPLDGVALHVTSRGYAYGDIHSTSKATAGGARLYFSFYVYKDWVEHGIPKSLYHLPLYATECNGYYFWKGGHAENPGAHYVSGWMQEVYAEINRYNQHAIAAGKPVFHCVNTYRWCGACDGWNIDGDNPYKTQILSDLDAAARQNYTWPDGTELRLSLIATSAVWRYCDDGSNQGTAWREQDFDDSGWALGTGQLGYGDNDETTVINGGPATNRFITTYFRRRFFVPDTSIFTNLLLRLLRDDGGVVYLNGIEVFRSNMPTNELIAFTTRALAAATGADETTNYYSAPLPTAMLRNGTNVVAVEIHQSDTNSSDVSFDLELKGLGNIPPKVRITEPFDGQISGAPTNLVVSASAVDPDGVLTSVEFYIGPAKAAADISSPYSMLWSNAPEGMFTLTAVAIDNGGKRATSAPVHCRIASTLVRRGSVWRYLDTGIYPGSNWRTTNYNDAGWLTGPAQLGYGDNDEQTVVRFGSDTQNRHITTWFRQRFEVTGTGDYTNMILRVLRDDGAVVYLNGQEVFRSNLPTNSSITPSTLALSAVPNEDEYTNFHSGLVHPALLVPEANLLAVEVHQSSPSSSDLSFDLELLGLRPPPAPRASIKLAGAMGILTWPAWAAPHKLQYSADVGPDVTWYDVSSQAVVIGVENVVLTPIQGGRVFFRLRKVAP